jgi:predicted membrane channel-forming protein YqfA (hemolysin III family)
MSSATWFDFDLDDGPFCESLVHAHEPWGTATASTASLFPLTLWLFHHNRSFPSELWMVLGLYWTNCLSSAIYHSLAWHAAGLMDTYSLMIAAYLSLALILLKEKPPWIWQASLCIVGFFSIFSLQAFNADEGNLPLLFAIPNAVTAVALFYGLVRSRVLGINSDTLLWIAGVLLGVAAALVYIRTERVCDQDPTLAPILWQGHGWFHLCAYAASVVGFHVFVRIYGIKGLVEDRGLMVS